MKSREILLLMVIQGFCYLLQTYCHGYADFKIFAYAEHREIPFSRPKMTIRFSPRILNLVEILAFSIFKDFGGDFGSVLVEKMVFWQINYQQY